MGERVRGIELSGRRVELSDGRYVFVGKHQKYPDETGIVMRNGKGEYTSFRLSVEAVSALRLLLSDPDSGVAGSPPSPELPLQWAVWTQVKP